MLTPRDSFKQSDQAKGWQGLVDSHQFQAAATAAMLELQFEISALTPSDMAGMGHWKMQGAKRFLEILMGLADTPLIPKATPRQNLEHRI
jgi:hypothetical protein